MLFVSRHRLVYGVPRAVDGDTQQEEQAQLTCQELRPLIAEPGRWVMLFGHVAGGDLIGKMGSMLRYSSSMVGSHALALLFIVSQIKP